MSDDLVLRVVIVADLVPLPFAIRARTADAKLLVRFGEPHRVYRTRTRRFLPTLTRQR